MTSIKNSALIWSWLSLLVLVIDLATKQMAEAWLHYGNPVYLLPVLDFTLLYNKGAAFSLLADQPGWQRWFFTIISAAVSVMLMVWMRRLPRSQPWLAVSLALILGGAVGNLVDRVLFGHVIDFISVHWDNAYFPAFNIADSAITAGAIMMAIDVIRDSISTQKPASDSVSRSD
ncbi:signal peptidase II [Oceanobacter sp. 3_MG-2023]|jgi:signal peptidase II|uniref:signal peptidase II n=1 Tax=Oceanobacter sp. 3_MG-2023 TaxID=3062622 RepID=UPI002734D78C|nr:signal peptidase II [Oceanobacter sp. 3_MG-2023]MDP2505230.1 signal peptidase II [Oceanobacter sp. 3_MG-2023]